LTLVDRKSRYLAAAILSSKGSEDIAASVIELMSCLPCQTLTFDNGKEFAGHAE
jgi:IS30 family transposase